MSTHEDQFYKALRVVPAAPDELLTAIQGGIRKRVVYDRVRTALITSIACVMAIIGIGYLPFIHRANFDQEVATELQIMSDFLNGTDNTWTNDIYADAFGAETILPTQEDLP